VAKLARVVPLGNLEHVEGHVRVVLVDRDSERLCVWGLGFRAESLFIAYGLLCIVEDV